MRIDINTLRKLINEAVGDTYKVLGVEPSASPFDVRKAWREKALRLRGQRQGGDPWAYSQIEDINAAKDAGERGETEYAGYENPDTLGPPAPAAPKGPGIPQKSKETYKVYAPWREKRAVVRVGGKVYGTGPGGKLSSGEPTKFKGGDRAKVGVTPSGKMNISSTEDDHTQEWDPIDQSEDMDDGDMDEVKKLISRLVHESALQEFGGTVPDASMSGPRSADEPSGTERCVCGHCEWEHNDRDEDGEFVCSRCRNCKFTPRSHGVGI